MEQAGALSDGLREYLTDLDRRLAAPAGSHWNERSGERRGPTDADLDRLVAESDDALRRLSATVPPP